MTQFHSFLYLIDLLYFAYTAIFTLLILYLNNNISYSAVNLDVKYYSFYCDSKITLMQKGNIRFIQWVSY